jgi:putative endonuclease
MCYGFTIMKAKAKPVTKSWVVYLLRCRDNSFYTGLTSDIEKRLMAHNKGIASKYTRARLPVKLITMSGCMNRKEAMRLEIRIKRIPKEKKIAALTGIKKAN